MRVARNEDGKTYYVPADMTYRKWEKKYVKDAASKKILGFLIQVNPRKKEVKSNAKYNRETNF